MNDELKIAEYKEEPEKKENTEKKTVSIFDEAEKEKKKKKEDTKKENNETVKDYKKASHEDVLAPKAVANVNYGGVPYEITPLSVSAMLKFIQIVSKQFVILKETNMDGSEFEVSLKLLGALEEEAIYEIVSLILKIEVEDVKKGYRTSDCIAVLVACFKIEDIKEIFFQVKLMKKMFLEKA